MGSEMCIRDRDTAVQRSSKACASCNHPEIYISQPFPGQTIAVLGTVTSAHGKDEYVRMRQITIKPQTTCMLVWQHGDSFAKTVPTTLEARPRHLLYSLRHRRICRWSNRSIVSPSWTETALPACSALLPVPPAWLPAPPAPLLAPLPAPLGPPSAPLHAPVVFMVFVL